MIKSFSLILALLFSLLLTAQDWVVFSDSSISFTAKYPVSWTNKIKEKRIVFFTSPQAGGDDSFLENINVIIRENPAFDSSLNFKEAMPGIIESLEKKMTQFKIIAERHFTWNNHTAAELKYSIDSKGETEGKTQHIKITQWFCALNGLLYTATYTSLAGDSIHDKTAVKILESFQFR